MTQENLPNLGDMIIESGQATPDFHLFLEDVAGSPGNWTPVYQGATTDPTCTYDLQFGKYLLLGGWVHCVLRIGTDAVTGFGTGRLRVGGLPFAPDLPDGNIAVPCQAWNWVGANGTYNSAKPGFMVLSNGNAYLQFEQQDGVTDVDATNAYLSNTSDDNRITANFSYPVK